MSETDRDSDPYGFESFKRLQRALLLYQHSRYKQAELELRAVLAADPQLALAHTTLAMCYLQLERVEEAEQEARQAISLDPGQSLNYANLASVMFHRNRTREALAAISKAIELDPQSASNFSILASLELTLDNPKRALIAANRGLAIDPEESGCAVVRGQALARLGRIDEATESAASALEKDPEDSFNHASLGIMHLHTGNHLKATEHFREALRLDPSCDISRFGVLQSMKARFVLHRWLIRFTLWFARFSNVTQWAMIGGGILAYIGARTLAKSAPTLAPYLGVFTTLCVAVMIAVWLNRQLLHLIMMFDPFARTVLTNDQKCEVFVTFGLLAFAGGLASAYLADAGLVFRVVAINVAITSLASSYIFNRATPWPRFAMATLVGLTLLCAIAPLAIRLAWQFSVIEPITVVVWLIRAKLWFYYGAVASMAGAILLPEKKSLS